MPTEKPLLFTLWQRQVPPSLDAAGWRQLLGRLRRAKLLARLAVLARERGWLDGLPEGVRVELRNAEKRVERRRLDTLWEGDRLVAALAPVGVPVVMLKGAAYVVAGERAAIGRDFSDIDILLPRDRLRDCETKLMAAGWAAKALDPYDDRYYRDWMHELPPMQHVQRMTHLDVHHTLTPPTSRWAIDIGRVRAACRPCEHLPGLLVPAPADLVIHSAVHLMSEGSFDAALRDLLDLSDLLGQHGAEPGFWDALLQRAGELGLTLPLHDALVLAAEFAGAPVPPSVQASLHQLHGRGPMRRAVIALLRHAVLQPGLAQAGWLDGPVGLALYIRSHWLRMPLHQLLPHLLRKAWMRLRLRLGSAPPAGPPGLRAIR